MARLSPSRQRYLKDKQCVLFIRRGFFMSLRVICPPRRSHYGLCWGSTLGWALHQMLVDPAVMDSEALDAHGQVIHSEPLRIASYTAGPPCWALARPA